MFFPIITENEKLLPIYLYGIGKQENQEDILRSDGVVHYQWTLCTEGSGVFIVHDKSYTIKKGMGFYFVPGFPHEYYALEEPWVTYWIDFNGASTSLLFNQLGLYDYGILDYSDANYSLLQKWIAIHESIEKQIAMMQIGNNINLLPLLVELLLGMRDHNIADASGSVIEDLRVESALLYMKTHIDQDITIEELAAHFGISNEYFCRLFKSEVHLSPIQYLMHLRIQEAKNLLVLYPNLSISDIAIKVGYNDANYFSSLFKRHEHMTPSQFRKIR